MKSKITVNLTKELADEFRLTCRILEITQDEGARRMMRHWFDQTLPSRPSLILAYTAAAASGFAIGLMVDALV